MSPPRIARLALVLMILAIIVVGPALAVGTGTIAWNESRYTRGATGTYTYTCGANVAKCIINISSPDGYYAYNGTNSSVSGVGTLTLSLQGTYTAGIYNGSSWLALDTDSTTTSVFNGVIEVIAGIVGFLPDLLELVVGMVPFVIVIALVVFIGAFFDRIMGAIR